MTVQVARDPGRGIRASREDREAVVAVLRDAYVAGRLTLDEFDERTSAAYAGRTWGELRGLTADLPGAPEVSAEPPGPAAPPDGPPLMTRRATVDVRRGRRPRLWPLTLAVILGLGTDSWLLAAVAVVTGVVSLAALSLIEGARLKR
jgi:Domain of unknown function (DUF1707)